MNFLSKIFGTYDDGENKHEKALECDENGRLKIVGDVTQIGRNVLVHEETVDIPPDSSYVTDYIDFKNYKDISMSVECDVIDDVVVEYKENTEDRVSHLYTPNSMPTEKFGDKLYLIKKELNIGQYVFGIVRNQDLSDSKSVKIKIVGWR